MPESNFLISLIGSILSDVYSFQKHNVDHLRFKQPTIRRLKASLRDSCMEAARGWGLLYVSSGEESSICLRWEEIAEDQERLERVSNLLADEESRQRLIELLKFRVLGSRRVKLTRNDVAYREAIKKMTRSHLRRRRTSMVHNTSLDYFEVPGNEKLLNLHCHSLNILNTFLLEQYRYQRLGNCVEAIEGDVVIDAGACWGDTSLYFSDQVGTSGKVFAFEPDSENRGVLQVNMDINPHLAERIEVLPAALWNETGIDVRYTPRGAGTSIVARSTEKNASAKTQRIDDFISECGLQRLDFIKMDIEGAELEALKGARDAIGRFKPKLAIAVYHSTEDLPNISLFLNSLGVGYNFFLDHFSIHQEETVLFASVRGT